MSRVVLAAILVKRAEERQIDNSDAYLRQRGLGGRSGITGGLLSSLLGNVGKSSFNPDQSGVDLVNGLSAQKATTDKQPVEAAAQAPAPAQPAPTQPAQPAPTQPAQPAPTQAPAQPTRPSWVPPNPEKAPFVPPSEPAQDLYAPEKQQLASQLAADKAATYPAQ
jgi:hypothetical protein